MDTAPQMSAQTAAEIYGRRQGAARRRGVRRWLLVTAGAVAVLAVGVYGARARGVLGRLVARSDSDPAIYVVRPVDLSISLTEDGELKPKKSVEVKCELEGQSTILWVVSESTRVKAGDLLVELASDAIKERLDTEEIALRQLESAFEAAEQSLKITRNENESQIKRCEVALELAKLELERYLRGDFARSLATAEMNIKQTQMDISRKEDELEKNRELAERGFVTKSKLDLLAFELEKARMTLDQNLLQMEILVKYEGPKNETQKRSDIAQATDELARERQRAESRERQAVAKVEEQRALLTMRRARVERLREQYQKCKIYAPVDGVVQYPSEESGWRFGGNRIAAGEKVYEGQTLIVLPDTAQMVVSTRIHEADRHKLREGLPCLVKVPAVPGRTFTGHVERIAQFADTANRWLNPELKEHSTEILLDQTDAPLSPGDSAEIRILIEERTGVLAVPVQCVYSRGSRNFVFVRRPGGPQHVEIGIGPANESMTEVTGGLAAGDEVLMHVNDELIAALPAPVIEPQAAEPVPVYTQTPPGQAAAQPPPPAQSPTGGAPPPTPASSGS